MGDFSVLGKDVTDGEYCIMMKNPIAPGLDKSMRMWYNCIMSTEILNHNTSNIGGEALALLPTIFSVLSRRLVIQINARRNNEQRC